MSILKSIFFVITHPYNAHKKTEALFRVIWWKINQVFFKAPVIIPFASNLKIICYPDSSYGSLIVYVHNPEHEEMSFISRYLKKKDIVFDIGANIGALSLLSYSKTAHTVYAFEPTPSIVNRFVENIKLNSLENFIKVFPFAVSNKNGFISFSVSQESERNHISFQKTSEKSKKRKVKAVTLDSFCKNHKIPQIDLLKIDVEGGEMLVFKGMKNLFKNKQVPTIIFEWNKNAPYFDYSILDLEKMFTEYGYLLYTIEDRGFLKLFHREKFDVLQTQNLVAVLKSNTRIQKYIQKD